MGNISFSLRMNLRRMGPMMIFGKPHRMLPYHLWKGKFWISLCYTMAFRSSPSPFPWSIFLISRCKHWKYSGLDPNSVSIQIHTNFMQIWGCFANHQFGWTWRGRIMGSTFKLKWSIGGPRKPSSSTRSPKGQLGGRYIDYISQNRHNRRWCTLEPVYLLA